MCARALSIFLLAALLVDFLGAATWAHASEIPVGHGALARRDLLWNQALAVPGETSGRMEKFRMHLNRLARSLKAGLQRPPPVATYNSTAGSVHHAVWVVLTVLMSGGVGFLRWGPRGAAGCAVIGLAVYGIIRIFTHKPKPLPSGSPEAQKMRKRAEKDIKTWTESLKSQTSLYLSTIQNSDTNMNVTALLRRIVRSPSLEAIHPGDALAIKNEELSEELTSSIEFVQALIGVSILFPQGGVENVEAGALAENLITQIMGDKPTRMAYMERFFAIAPEWVTPWNPKNKWAEQRLLAGMTVITLPLNDLGVFVNLQNRRKHDSLSLSVIGTQKEEDGDPEPYVIIRFAAEEHPKPLLSDLATTFLHTHGQNTLDIHKPGERDVQDAIERKKPEFIMGFSGSNVELAKWNKTSNAWQHEKDQNAIKSVLQKHGILQLKEKLEVRTLFDWLPKRPLLFLLVAVLEKGVGAILMQWDEPPQHPKAFHAEARAA